MNVVKAVICIVLISTAVIASVYVVRGEFAIGSEWAIPIILGIVFPIKEKESQQ